MNYKTPEFIHRKGIVMSRELVPFESALTFNAGITRYKDGYVMLFRNDYGFCKKDFDDFYAGISDNTTPHINIGKAFSTDGIHWKVEEKPVLITGDSIKNTYDPRITDIGNGQYGICFAVASKYGTRGGIAVTEDFTKFDIQYVSVPENRNMVLFPEKINGKYCRLERPFFGSNEKKFGIWMSYSYDLIHWGESVPLLMPCDVPFANAKIGPAAPPVRTSAGWLTLFHAVEEVEHPLNAWAINWNRRYYAGVMLLDLKAPSRILSMAKRPLLVPETDYECAGFRGEVIFPGGFIVEDKECIIYYGAADTVECLATASLDEIIDFCHNN